MLPQTPSIVVFGGCVASHNLPMQSADGTIILSLAIMVWYGMVSSSKCSIVYPQSDHSNAVSSPSPHPCLSFATRVTQPFPSPALDTIFHVW